MIYSGKTDTASRFARNVRLGDILAEKFRVEAPKSAEKVNLEEILNKDEGTVLIMMQLFVT